MIRVPLPPLSRRLVHLAVLSAFGFAQPLFEVLTNSPEFFVVRASTRLDVIVFALAVVLIPPAILALAELAVGAIDERAASLLHLVLVGALSALLAIQALKRVDGLGATTVLTLAGLLAAGGAVAYWRAAPIRSILTVLGPMPLVLAGLFLVNAPIGELGGTEAAQARAAVELRKPAPIVFLLLDELATTSLLDDRGRIDAARYPNFGALAADATWFRNATTVHEHTTEAVPALLSGKNWRKGQLPILSDHPDNLFTLLEGRYRFRVFEPVTQLCPQKSCPRARDPFASRMESLAADLGYVYLHVLLPSQLTRDLPSVTETWQGFGQDDHADEARGKRRPLVISNEWEIDRMVGRELWRDQRAAFDAFVASIEAGDDPTLYFLHAMLPHSPWRYLPSGRQYGNALGLTGLLKDKWTQDPWLVTQAWQRHLLQVGFTDRLLGKLLRRLRREGMYDRSLIIVTADHGLGFQPGDKRRDVTPTNVGDIAGVPLLVKRPGQRHGRVVDAYARSLDVVPTIADVLDARLAYRVEGTSLFDAARREPREIAIGERDSSRVVAATAAVTAQRAQTLRRQLALFGSGRRSLYAVGPRPALLGRAVAAFRVAAATGAEVEVDGENLLRSVDMRSPLAPSHITGRISGAGDGPLALAVAVNGRIRATTWANGGTRFSALVPESAFRQGANEVSVFAIRGRGGRVTLERLGGGRRARFELGTAGGRDVIRGAGGSVIPIVPRALRGRVEDWFFERETVRFGGWAVDAARERLPDRVLVFVDGRFLYSGTTTVERWDLPHAKANPALGESGFVFELPRTAVGNEGGAKLRFFAVSGDTASELAYVADFPWR